MHNAINRERLSHLDGKHHSADGDDVADNDLPQDNGFDGFGYGELHAAPLGEAQAAPAAHYLSAVIGGKAVAIGNDASAAGFVENRAENIGNCTVAFGMAIFSANGHMFEHAAATAVAQTFVHVTGADYLFEMSFNEIGVGGTSAWAVSETEYIAVDFHNGPSKNAITIETHALNAEVTQYLPPADLFGFSTGNVADAIALAEVHGRDMFAATLTHALIIENHFSSVSGLAAIAA